MKKVAQDFVLTLKEKYTDDEMVEIATLFVQSIAYGTDETQINRYPYETFFEEQGNCLDKSVILVYLLEELGYTSYIILGESTEYHALVGIACESGANMKVEGNNVCFIETTIFTPIGTAVDIEVEQVIPFSVGNNVYRGTSYGPSLVDDIETTKFEITQINQNVDVHIDNLGFIESDMCATDCVICDANGIDFERSNNEITSCNDANTYNNLVTEYNLSLIHI